LHKHKVCNAKFVQKILKLKKKGLTGGYLDLSLFHPVNYNSDQTSSNLSLHRFSWYMKSFNIL